MPAMLADRDAHLRAIQHAPDDDAPRLIFADWLDEHGEDARASFIRVQVELAQVCSRRPGHNAGTATAMRDPMTVWRETVDALRRRESELLQPNASKWFSLPGLSACSVWDHPPKIRWFPTLTTADSSSYVIGGDAARGFLDTIRGPLVTLIGGECESCSGVGDDGGRAENHTVCPTCHGKGRTLGIIGDLFRQEPITRVEFTDREPERMASSGYTFSDYMLPGFAPRSVLPAAFTPFMDLVAGEYRTNKVPSGTWWCFKPRVAAIDALSAAAVALGRKRAGLTLEGASK